MRSLVLLALLHSLWGRVANADRRLPADLQVDLIFPRNETYAPTQWFPIVFGVQNLDALWPLDIYLDLEVWSSQWNPLGNRTVSWQHKILRLNYEQFAAAAGPSPGKYFFHIPTINMTNGTTDQYQIKWEVDLQNRCFANNTDPRSDTGGDGWSNRPPANPYFGRYLDFSTAPGTQVPDIAATVNSCAEPDEETSAVVRITDVKKTYSQGNACPVLDTNVTAAKCSYKAVAKELAANVSTAMLGKMSCKEGTWQNIAAPCPNGAASLTFGLGWVLALAFGMSCVV